MLFWKVFSANFKSEGYATAIQQVTLSLEVTSSIYLYKYKELFI